ncbi:MAG: hypothetical protein ABIH46_11175 [Chloroflexota bacterium]
MFRYLAAEGRGCCHCEVGVPVERIESRRGTVLALCLECVRLWFPGKTVEWWEARHAPFLDHVDMALRRSREKEAARNMEALVAMK